MDADSQQQTPLSTIDDEEEAFQPLLQHQGLSTKTKCLYSGVALALVLGVGSILKSNSSSVSNLLEKTEENNNIESLSTTTNPNIFLFTVDDLGWNDIGYNSGDLEHATPYVNEIVKKSIKLSQYYTQPSCTPSRVTMMTGKFAYKNGFQNYELVATDYIGVPLSNKMMPEYMSDLGYKTIGFGKWNIGHCNEKYLPSARGFDHFIGYLCPGHGYVNHNCGNKKYVKDMIEGWTITDDDGETTHKWQDGSQYVGTYDTLLYREKSTAAIHNHFSDDDSSATPLFMWMAHHGIHAEGDEDPVPPSSLLTKDNLDYLKVLKKRLSEVGSEEDGYTQFFKMRMITASVLMSVDNCFNRLLDTLETVGELSDSVILFHGDNGGSIDYTTGHPGNNYPLRSWKFGYYEGGIRVPAFVYAPGLIPESREGGTYDGLMHHVDLIDTFVHLGGGDTDALLVEYDDLDSLDQWDAIIDNSASPRDELVLNLPRSKEWKLGSTATEEGVAIRIGDYKMLINNAFDSWFSPAPPKDFHEDTSEMMAQWCKTGFYSYSDDDDYNCVYSNYLFNVVTDPNESTNLWENAEYDAIRESLIARAEELVANVATDYGQIIPEYYSKKESLSGISYSEYFEGNHQHVVPFDCAPIP
jgi:arylsulfatase A-like enzyme